MTAQAVPKGDPEKSDVHQQSRFRERVQECVIYRCRTISGLFSIAHPKQICASSLKYNMPPFVRKTAWRDRIQAYLNPYDFLLWLSEEIETHDFDEKTVAYTLGPILNITFLVARANSSKCSRVEDDVFGDDSSCTGWFTWFVCSVCFYQYDKVHI